MIFFSISFFLCCFTPSLSQIDQTFTSLSSSSSNSHLYQFIILLTTATEVHAPSLKLTHRSSIANPCTITHLQSPIHSSIILTDSSSSSLLTRFIIANPRTITNPFSFSSIILAEALYSISHHRGQWARVYVCGSGLVFSDLWAFWCNWWNFREYFVYKVTSRVVGSYVFGVLFMSLWHLSEVLVGNGCVHNGFCLSSPLIMLSLFLSLVCVWLPMKKPAYFTIQLIFVTIHGLHILFGTIHGSHYTILANFYFYLQYYQ